MIFAETDRLVLRTLEKKELPRLVELIGVWDVVRWLAVVPFPYKVEHAEEFFVDMQASYATNDPQFYAMAFKTDNKLIGGVGLHPPRNEQHLPGEIEIGYWLGKDYWGQGLMHEAARRVRDLGFARPATRSIGATTAIGNHASQNVLQKIGLRNMGQAPRDYSVLRGDDQIIKWLLTREQYNFLPLAGRVREGGVSQEKTAD
jgi:RimJ/RimL family protein N-acetyltransferase